MDTVVNIFYLYAYQPIASLYIENKDHQPSESRTAAKVITLGHIISMYIASLALSIFSVPIGHAILHGAAKYDVPVLSSLEVGAVGGVIISTAIGAVFLRGLNEDSEIDLPRIVLEILDAFLFLAIACMAGATGAAILLKHHALVLHVPEAAAAATLGCLLVQATVLGMNFAIKAMISRCRRYQF